MHIKIPALRRAWSVVACLFAPLSAFAISVVPPTFPELVAEAETIAHGRVTHVESRKVTNAAGHELIKTFVTFEVASTLKGKATPSLTLAFLGGTVGDETLDVPGMPRFRVGEEDYVFVTKNGRVACPLIGAGHGRYRVLRDSSRDAPYIARQNRQPLQSTDEVALPLAQALPPAAARTAMTRALAPAEFDAQIAAEVSRLQSSRRSLP